MRVGIFGGTFNPPHVGHLICAQEARWQLDLEAVLLIPVGDAPHKEIEQDAGREVRYEMCRIMAEPEGWLGVSRLEVDREGPSYTVDTLGALQAESPGDELFVILGGDAAAELATWREPEQVLARATVAVAERDEARKEKVVSALADLSGSERVVFFSMPRIEISSTMVRERSAAGRPIRYLVPGGVAAFIEETGLYGAGAALESAGQRA